MTQGGSSGKNSGIDYAARGADGALNPYRAPVTEARTAFEPDDALAHTVFAEEASGAKLTERYFGHVIDNLVLCGLPQLAHILLDSGVPWGLAGAKRAWFLALAWGLPVLALQSFLIAWRGQSIGKLALGTRIVDAGDGRRVGFVRAVLVRTWLVWMPALLFNDAWIQSLPRALVIPVIVGCGLLIADGLTIFGKPRRCLHDYLAGTRVVRV